MRYRLALAAQTLSAAVDGLASLEITHGCQAWLSWATLGRRSECRPDGVLREPETRWRQAKPKEQEETMPRFARRNLFPGKIRLAVTFTGIIFAVLLMVVESGLFLEFSTTTSSLIDRSRADLWIGAHHFPRASSTRFAQLPASPPRRSTSRGLRSGSTVADLNAPDVERARHHPRRRSL